MIDRMAIELYKVKREINMHGSEYVVQRYETDSRGESTNIRQDVKSIRGLFHIVKGYIRETRSDAVHIHSKGQPKLLVLWEDIEDIKQDDIIIINQKEYKVIEVNNIEEYNIVCDISLEVVIDGVSS